MPEENLALKRSEGRREVTYADLYERLLDFDKPLTVIERLLLGAILKRMSVSKEIKVKITAFAGDIYIDMSKKQDHTQF